MGQTSGGSSYVISAFVSDNIHLKSTPRPRLIEGPHSNKSSNSSLASNSSKKVGQLVVEAEEG